MIVIWLLLALLLIERTSVVQSSLFVPVLTELGTDTIVPCAYTSGAIVMASIAGNAKSFLLLKPLSIHCALGHVNLTLTNKTKAYHYPFLKS